MLTGRKVPLTLAFAVLLVMAFGVSCHGFFPDPRLVSVAVSPATPTIPVTDGSGALNTKQFTAVGTFDDNSTSSTPVTWDSGDPTTIASISDSGKATAIATGTTTITATSIQNPSLSGSTTLTIVPANVTALVVTPSSQSTTVAAGFNLVAKDQSGNDISDSVTWTFYVTTTTTVETGITGAAAASGEDFTIGTLAPNTAPVTVDAVATLTVSGHTITSNKVTVNINP